MRKVLNACLRRGALPFIFMCLAAWCSAGEYDQVYHPGQLPAAFTQDESTQRTIVFAGDIMTWDRSAALIRREGASYPFDAVEPLIHRADLAVGNLEGPVALRASLAVEPGYRYKVPPFTLAGLRDAGFDLLCLANNHVMDCGSQGVDETLAHLRDADMRGFGGGMNMADASQPLVVTIGDTRVAFVAAVCPETYFMEWHDAAPPGAYERQHHAMARKLGADIDQAGTVIATPQSVTELVRRAAAEADLVIASFHFGVRYHRTPTDRQRALAHAAVEAGADLVVGHHAHIWQPAEVYQGAAIFYGLGNFAFGSANRRADEGLLIRAVLDEHRIASVDIFPIYTKNRDPDVNYQPKVLAGEAAQQVIADLARQSADYGANIFYHGGRGRLDMSVDRGVRQD